MSSFLAGDTGGACVSLGVSCTGAAPKVARSLFCLGSRVTIVCLVLVGGVVGVVTVHGVDSVGVVCLGVATTGEGPNAAVTGVFVVGVVIGVGVVVGVCLVCRGGGSCVGIL